MIFETKKLIIQNLKCERIGEVIYISRKLLGKLTDYIKENASKLDINREKKVMDN